MSEENKTLIYAELQSGTVGGYVTDYSQIKNAPDPKVNTINELTGQILPNPNDSNISHAVAKAYDSQNNSIFIESHAKATYMSDGSTVEDAIKNINLSNYETKVESQNKLQEAKSYTDTAIANLVDSAPETLNTLNELATAIQDNEDVVEALNQSIGSKQDKLISGTNIKTVNGQSLLGNGDLEIQEFKTYIFEYEANQENIISQEELNEILESDKIYIKHSDRLVEVITKNEFDNLLVLSGYFNNNKYVNEYHININKNDLTCLYTRSNTTLVTKSELVNFTDVYYYEILCPNIEDGLVLEEQYIDFDSSKISVLVVNVPSDESFKGFYLRSNAIDVNATDFNYSTIIFYGKYTDDSLLKATYNPENQTLTFNIIEQNVSAKKTIQTIQLNQGWNWVSFYVETSLEKLQNALGTNGIEIKYMDFTTSYDEESGLWLSAGNPLTSIEPSKMYMINVNSDCVIELEGKLLEDVEITLNQGENNISYPLEYESDINTALQNLNATQGDMIKGYGTTLIATYFNGKWVGPLTTLKPGQGYQYTSNSAETIIFKYPDSIDLKLSYYTTKEYVNEEINQINTKIDSLHNKTAIQTIELTEGWNSVSFYVDITLEQLQEALGNNALQIKDEVSRKFIQYSQESGWYGTLKELVAGRYYGINIASSCKILLTGTLLNSNEITYSIGSGHSYIGYPLNHKLNINTAFKSIEPQEGDYLSTYINGEKETISQYSEGVWNGVQQLVPGQGYTYYSNADTNKHFTYPSVEIDFLSFVTEDDLKSKLQEAKDYTDTKTDELRDVVTQTLSLHTGNNWCSFYVDITLEQLQQALGANATSIITSFDGSTEITSSYDATTNTWSGDLTTLDVTKMYLIYLNTNCEVSLTGKKIPNSIIYTLNPGQNWISYPINEPIFINKALKGLDATEGDQIKFYGNTFAEYFDGEWDPVDFIFEPGQGYMYKNTSTEPKTLVFTTELIDTKSELNKKQDVLVSGTNIKTINGESLLGEGNIVISGETDMSNYYTKEEIDNTIGDINTILESIING